ncbi:MAG: hypothetical protein PHI97_34140 [Desulfobulbus sp.]|nr:hypothetical protein [Desulfobulbus sp.]
MNRTTEVRYSLVFGVVGIFFLSPIFVPLAVIFGVAALFKKQIILGVLGLFCAFIGFTTSPILLSLFVFSNNGFQNRSFKWEYVPRQQIERPRTDSKKEFI